MSVEQLLVVVPWLVVLAASLVAVVLDLRSRRIPNRLTLPLLVAGLVWAGVTAGVTGLLLALLAAVLVSLPFVLMWLLGGAGAGDAKLLAAVAAWLGLADGFVALLGVALAGGVLAAGYVLTKRTFATTARNFRSIGYGLFCLLFARGTWADRRALAPQVQIQASMPYAVAIFTGTLAAGGWAWLHGG